MLDRSIQLLDRLATYPTWQVIIELAVIWMVVFAIVRFVQGTRAAGAIKGMLFVLVTATLLVRIVGQHERFLRLTFLYERFLALLAITLVVVFQPELRRGLIRLGETPVGGLFRRASGGTDAVIDAIVDASAYLSKLRYGGLIVIEREVGLRGIVEGGTEMNAEVSARLLQTIFFPGSALHDLAVVIQGDRILSAGVQLPLAEPEEMPDAALGSRHRAAVGLSRETDALVVVISEETGSISLSERGRLDRGLTTEQLRQELTRRLAGGNSGGEGFGGVAASPLGQGLGRLGKRVVSAGRAGGNGRRHAHSQAKADGGPGLKSGGAPAASGSDRPD